MKYRSSPLHASSHLICLGDVCDGWPEVSNCFDELLKIRNLTYLLGNHDLLTLNWISSNEISDVWLANGGESTMNCYAQGVPISHRQLLEEAHSHHILNNKLFVHAGFLPEEPIKNQDSRILLWDRSLFLRAIDNYINQSDQKLTSFDEVYIGHSPLSNYGIFHPIQSGDVWMMDTGAGWSGVLAILNIVTKEYFVSDSLPELYPGIPGRRRSK